MPARDNLIGSFNVALITLVMPIKLVASSVHNILSKRDYSYSIDDWSDIALAICIFIWIYTYLLWREESAMPGLEDFDIDPGSRYTIQIMYQGKI